MTEKDRIRDGYFEWLVRLIGEETQSSKVSYRRLLVQLHNTEFIYSIPRDRNRADDGIGLRRRFATAEGCTDVLEYLDDPCSVLEMMIGLSVRCEETIMDDPMIGDRTGQWFWNMITNLGLGGMYDSRFDRRFVEDILIRFLDREYEPNGRGGLFTINNCEYDLRTVEIWHQLLWYLDDIF